MSAVQTYPNAQVLLGLVRATQCDQATDMDTPGPVTHYTHDNASKRRNTVLYPLQIGSMTNWWWSPMLVLQVSTETELNVLTTQ